MLIDIKDIRYIKQFKEAQAKVEPLVEHAKTDPAFAMAAAAMWIGYELSKEVNAEARQRVRDKMVWFIDAEAFKKDNDTKCTTPG
jgi:hypothetical protein